MGFFVSVLARRASVITVVTAARVFGVALVVGVGDYAAHAQAPSVVYVVNGRLANRDYFGGGGTLENVLPTLTGDNLDFDQTLVNPAGTSETSLAFSSSVVGNRGTFSSSFSSLVQRAYSAGPEFFIYANSSDIAIDAYVLGVPGTPYQFEVVSTGFNDSFGGAEGSYSASAASAGQAYPGQAYFHQTPGGTYSETGFSSGISITYLGNTYTLVGPGPRGSSSAFFGITGTPTSGGFTHMHASHSFISTVTNLAVLPAAAPEPGSIALALVGGLGLLGAVVRRYKG